MNSEIIHENNRFIKIVDGKQSFLEYEEYGPVSVIFSHTFVPEELRGKGLAKKIIKAGLDWAISNNLKIVPACSAVRVFIERNKEYKAHVAV